MDNYVMPQGLDPSIPGRILPGQPGRITNAQMNTHEELRMAMMRSPALLQTVARHFTRRTGLISELTQWIGGSNYDPMALHMKSQKDLYNRSAIVNRNVNSMKAIAKQAAVLDQYRFIYRGKKQHGYVPTIMEDVPATNGLVGIGRSQFVFKTRTTKVISVDDLITLADMRTQIQVKKVRNRGTHLEVTAKLNLSRQAINIINARRTSTTNPWASIGIPADLLKKGREFMVGYNVKPEASNHGSRSELEFGEFYEEYMTTLRWEWDTTGHVAGTKNNKNCMLVEIMDVVDGKPYTHTYWTDILHWNMMQNAYRQLDHFLFWGQPVLDNDGKFAIDEKGREYISGTGFYHQCSQKNRSHYNKMTFDLLEKQISKAYDSIPDGTKPTLLFVGGKKIRSEVGRILRNQFNTDSKVLYWDGNGGYKGVGKDKEGSNIQGLRSNFTYFETEIGRIMFSPISYLDSHELPTRRDMYGNTENSGRAFMINLTDQIGGENQMMTVTLAGRSSVLGTITGMSNVKDGGTLTTPKDIEGEHLLMTYGMANMNPNCLIELSETPSRFTR